MTATARRRVRPQEPSRTISCGRRNPLIPNDATASDRTDRKKRPSFYFAVQRAPRSVGHGVLRRPPDAPRSLIAAPDCLIG